MRRQLAYLSQLVLFVVLCAACAPAQPVPQETPSAEPFSHTLKDGPKPWTEQSFDNAEGKYTFAVFSDLTGGERPDVYRVAIEQLRLLRPELIMNVGDLIEGGTRDRQQLSREWESFDERTARASAPVFRVSGNHDLTNTTMRDVWEERYGPRYYHFRYKDTLFLVLDTEDHPAERLDEIHEIRNQGMERVMAEGWGIYGETEYAQLVETASGRISQDQADYFIQALEENSDVRWTFLFMHKPAWKRPQEENFSQIETALAERPYTVFHGHVHSYKHENRHGRDYIRLSTTGGVQIPSKDMPVDHVTLVTVDEGEPDIINLRLSGLFDKTGKIPLNGEDLCFEVKECGQE